MRWRAADPQGGGATLTAELPPADLRTVTHVPMPRDGRRCSTDADTLSHTPATTRMNRFVVALLPLLALAAVAPASPAAAQGTAPQARPAAPAARQPTRAEQALLDLSRAKWRWMADRKVDTLAALFHDDAVFVHMGGAWGRTQEIDVIRGGQIHYKHAEIFDASVKVIGSTAILLNRIRLDAVVGGNEVSNPFLVTEVYVRQGDAWRLGSLSFTRLLGQ